jgi:hypothetical protein
MPLVLEVLEAKEAAVGVSAPRSVVAAAVAFTHHLAVILPDRCAAIAGRSGRHSRNTAEGHGGRNWFDSPTARKFLRLLE